MGYRFRVNYPVPGFPRRTVDVAFTRAKVAVFINGCFWHVCPKHASWPTSNADWWQSKLLRNVERDAETDQWLVSAGWTVVRVWEHNTPEEAVKAVVAALPAR